MLSVVDHHKNSEEERSSIERIISASLIVCFLQKIGIDKIRHELIADLLQLFHFQPDIHNCQCHDLNVLKTLLQQNNDMK